jgi:hypothetical protein
MRIPFNTGVFSPAPNMYMVYYLPKNSGMNILSEVISNYSYIFLHYFYIIYTYIIWLV